MEGIKRRSSAPDSSFIDQLLQGTTPKYKQTSPRKETSRDKNNSVIIESDKNLMPSQRNAYARKLAIANKLREESSKLVQSRNRKERMKTMPA